MFYNSNKKYIIKSLKEKKLNLVHVSIVLNETKIQFQIS